MEVDQLGAPIGTNESGKANLLIRLWKVETVSAIAKEERA
jgi:hypothetical protein